VFKGWDASEQSWNVLNRVEGVDVSRGATEVNAIWNDTRPGKRKYWLVNVSDRWNSSFKIYNFNTSDTITYEKKSWDVWSLESSVTLSQGCRIFSYNSDKFGEEYTGGDSVPAGEHFVWFGNDECVKRRGTGVESQLITTDDQSFEPNQRGNVTAVIGLEDSKQASEFSACGESVFYYSDDQNRLQYEYINPTSEDEGVSSIPAGEYLALMSEGCEVEFKDAPRRASRFCVDRGYAYATKGCHSPSPGALDPSGKSLENAPFCDTGEQVLCKEYESR
jgi:hypothetical protein